MSYREVSAWAMAALLDFAGVYYIIDVRAASIALGHTAPPSAVLHYVSVIVIGTIAAQVTLGVLLPKEADAPADERERAIAQRAGNWAGYVLAAGALAGLGHYYYHGDGDMFFHIVMAGLILTQIADYAFQILLFRRGA